MTLRKLMLEARQNLLKEERKLEKQISSAPPGSLIYSKNTVNNKIFYKWYVSGRTKEGKRTKIYIPQKNRNYARALAKKRLRVKRLRDVKAQIRAVDAFLAKYRENSDLDDLLDAPMVENLLAEEVRPPRELAEELKRWAEEKYEMNPAYEELRVIPTVDNIKVRSKSEALIVMLLSTLHIPYRYDARLDIGNHVYYPECFLVPNIVQKRQNTEVALFWHRASMPKSRKSRGNKTGKTASVPNHPARCGSTKE